MPRTARELHDYLGIMIDTAPISSLRNISLRSSLVEDSEGEGDVAVPAGGLVLELEVLQFHFLLNPNPDPELPKV